MRFLLISDFQTLPDEILADYCRLTLKCVKSSTPLDYWQLAMLIELVYLKRDAIEQSIVPANNVEFIDFLVQLCHDQIRPDICAIAAEILAYFVHNNPTLGAKIVRLMLMDLHPSRFPLGSKRSATSIEVPSYSHGNCCRSRSRSNSSNIWTSPYR